MHLEDSLATQCELRSKLSETKHSLTVQRNAFDLKEQEILHESHTELHDSDPPESLRKTQDVHGSPWGDESEYSSDEIHVTASKVCRPIKLHSRPPKKIPADPHLVKVIEVQEAMKRKNEALKRVEAWKRDKALKRDKV